jgi:hypothetical protein
MPVERGTWPAAFANTKRQVQVVTVEYLFPWNNKKKTMKLIAPVSLSGENTETNYSTFKTKPYCLSNYEPFRIKTKTRP